MKKIVIIVLVIAALVMFYQKFVAPTMSEFFGSHKGGLDFHGKSSLDSVP